MFQSTTNHRHAEWTRAKRLQRVEGDTNGYDSTSRAALGYSERVNGWAKISLSTEAPPPARSCRLDNAIAERRVRLWRRLPEKVPPAVRALENRESTVLFGKRENWLKNLNWNVFNAAVSPMFTYLILRIWQWKKELFTRRNLKRGLKVSGLSERMEGVELAAGLPQRY